MSFFGKNIKKIRGVKRLSQQAFSEIFSLKRATLGAYEEGRSEPKIDTIIRVANYFSITIDDILTKEITINELLSFDGGFTTNVNQVVKMSFAEVPFVNALNMSDFISDFTQSAEYGLLPKISIPIIAEDTMLAFAVQDLVMVRNEQGLFPGDVVIGKRVSDEELNDGDVLIVMVKKTMFVRRILKHEKHYELKADHINVSSEIIKFDEEFSFWRVSDVFLRRYPNFTSKFEDRMNELNAKIEKLSK
jgi:transcriptional regulator with XRE-family HTH domain